MSARLSHRLDRQASEGFAGRGPELEALGSLLAPVGPRVFHLSGAAGIGKSRLAEVFSSRARQAGVTVLRLDCRTIEPSVPGFLDAVRVASGSGDATIASVSSRLGGLGDPLLVVLDSYERFWLLDTFLRLEFAPALPDSVRLLLVGRYPAVPAWLSSPAWQGLFVASTLGPLTERDSLSYLRGLGLDSAASVRVNAVARGSPLALTMAAQATADRGTLRPEDAAASALMDIAAGDYLAAVEAPLRATLEAASVVRRVTVPLLRAMLPDVAPADAIDRLAALPFVDRARDGLFIHDAVRDAIATNLEAADPNRHRAYRIAAWRQLRADIAHAPAATLWRYTADILFLLRNPLVREGFFPSGFQPLVVEPAAPGDAEAIRSIAARHQGPDGAAITGTWWQVHPEAFRVCRNASGDTQGVFIALAGAELSEDIINADPVAARWFEDMCSSGGAGQSLLLRLLLDRDEGEATSGSKGAFGVDIKRTYMEMRPNLRYIYICATQPENLDWCYPLGFERLSTGSCVIDGSPVHSNRLDMGPGSVDSWLARVVASELGIREHEGDTLFDAEAHELVVGPSRVPLTPLEYGLMAALVAHPGRPVSRADLIEQVWGYDASGTSNVVDAVVLSLRRKLGPHASAIETVRGTGYRYVSQ
jgi:hypothetical protein